MKNKQYGKCMICGKEGELTFEHIPPKKAYNNTPTKTYGFDEFNTLICDENRLPWDYSGLTYNNSQRGSGKFSLCEKCNNITGRYYGAEYSRIANDTISNFLMNESKVKEAKVLSVTYSMYPLRFIKQIISMFCSVTQGLVECFPEIKELLLNKEYVIANPKFKVFMFFMKNQRDIIFGPICIGNSEGNTIMLSSMDIYPFGFIFDYDGKYDNKKHLFDITRMLSFPYDKKAETEITAPIVERQMPFPLDFRTREEFLETNNIDRSIR
ncbi:MAG: hypothetical protein ACI32B_03260 [Erysipelotrichaceae bacterium]